MSVWFPVTLSIVLFGFTVFLAFQCDNPKNNLYKMFNNSLFWILISAIDAIAFKIIWEK